MKLAFIVAAVMLAGCATTEQVWVKDGASERDFSMDRGQCQAQAFGPGGVTLMQAALIMNGCMQGKGWHTEDRPIRR